ncbi:MAG: arabinogalactan endo-1,4-beta-galactosidase, partial [Bacteroidales bacterium]|nr:arabinogalactan endo-1,4-beta-galactosidase [Bacteroidales bacterium]
MKKYLLLIPLILFGFSCQSKSQDQTKPLSTQDFAKGADISWLPQMEASG